MFQSINRLLVAAQVIGVMDAMPNTNLKPEGEDMVLESDRMYRTTYMFRCYILPAAAFDSDADVGIGKTCAHTHTCLETIASI